MASDESCAHCEAPLQPKEESPKQAAEAVLPKKATEAVLPKKAAEADEGGVTLPKKKKNRAAQAARVARELASGAAPGIGG
jgi:hypothetical protein